MFQKGVAAQVVVNNGIYSCRRANARSVGPEASELHALWTPPGLLKRMDMNSEKLFTTSG